MGTDRELLEAAARAAGIAFDEKLSKPHPVSGTFWGLWRVFDGEPPWTVRRYWSPLTDAGDALRLAVKLRAEIDIGSKSVAVRLPQGIKVILELGHDHNAATRRAIVRAAAATAPAQGGSP